MRSLEEINDIGRRALVDALGSDDAERFMAHLRSETTSSSDAASLAPGAARTARTTATEADELPPQTVEEAHKTIRDMQDPMEQQHLL